MDTYITVGVGQHQMWAAQFYKFSKPRRWLSSSGLGTMGFGLPAAMGVQTAHPNSIVVDIDGDGSFQMNIQELATLHCEKLPVKILLLNNQHLGMVVQWEDRFMSGRRAHTYLGPIDHPEALGEGDGSRCLTKPSPTLWRLPKVTAFRLAGSQQGGVSKSSRRNAGHKEPLPAGCDLSLSGTRAADDPKRSNRA
jgi:hypothetical protein